MRKKFYNSEKINGELATKLLCDEAREFYNTTDPLSVYEIESDDGEKIYCIRGYQDIDDMTFNEMEAFFVEQYKEMQE